MPLRPVIWGKNDEPGKPREQHPDSAQERMGRDRCRASDDPGPVQRLCPDSCAAAAYRDVGRRCGRRRGFGYVDFGSALTAAIVGYLLALGVLFLMGLIANALAPSFDGARNDVSAMKLVVYAATPTWIAGFFGFVPGLGLIVSLLGFAYAAYLLYLGSMAVMKVPEATAVGYTVVIIIIWVILSVMIVGAIISGFYGGAMLAERP